MASGKKNGWALFLLLLAGIVLGSFLGHLCEGISALSWLDYGKTFGLTSPLKLDLSVLVLTFGLSVHISIASIIGVLVAILIYRLI